ncbi:trypsin-like peptidase domain-containing protein [Candidatus Parcubacteria bacterium]|nr:trypsin-like peptidase domain-containing protein [Candidatus Parcubacteria bacterium]
MNIQKGFIQIPILILIVVGIIVIGGAIYFGINQYQNYQAQNLEKEKQAQDLILAQQKAIEKTIQEIEELRTESQEKKQEEDSEMDKMKEEMESLKEQQAETAKKQEEIPQKEEETKQDESIITASEINPYLTGVGEIYCAGSSPARGSVSLWHFSNELGYTVLTNKHVITTNNCDLVVSDTAEDTEHSGVYNLGIEIYNWNNKTDVAVLKIESLGLDISVPISSLNYKISSLSKCSSIMAIGSPVMVVGFPAFAEAENEYGLQTFLTMTNGIISAQDISVKWGEGKLPYSNYFVSAKIDSGNSGGIAFSKDENGLCVLGVPTWLSIGHYETQGIIQNIHNVMYQQ